MYNYNINKITQLAGIVEYINCISAVGLDPALRVS